MKFTTSIAVIFLTQTTTASFLKSGDVFSDGLSEGKQIAEDIWSQSGSDCSNVWSFQSSVESVVSEEFPNRGNWRKKSFNRGARSGAQQVVEKYEKRCLDNSPDECNDVGMAAAAEIAYVYCTPPADDAQAMDMPMNYKASCRSVAYGICEGNVGSMVKANGCSLTTSQTLSLQRKCEDQVDSMTEENDDTIIIIPTQPIVNSRCGRKSSCSSCIGNGNCAWVEGDGFAQCYDSCDDPNYPADTLWICMDGSLNTPDVCGDEVKKIE